MVLSVLFLAISASLAPAPVVAQSGDLNSLGRVLSRFENLSTFAELLTVSLKQNSCKLTVY